MGRVALVHHRSDKSPTHGELHLEHGTVFPILMMIKHKFLCSSKTLEGRNQFFFFSFKLQSRFFLRASKVNNTDAKNSLPEHKRRPIILSYEEEAIHHNCTKLLKISLKLQSFDVAQNTRETAIDAKNRICVTH